MIISVTKLVLIVSSCSEQHLFDILGLFMFTLGIWNNYKYTGKDLQGDAKNGNKCLNSIFN